MNIKLLPLLAITLLFGSVELFAQQQQSRCKTEPEYRQFDFWIGEWEVKNPQDAVVGQSKIELILGECVIFENWTSATPGYEGKSFSYYNARTKTWQQKWIDTQAAPIEFDGTFNDEAKALEYAATGYAQDGSKLDFKLTFHHLSDDHVRQHWEQSADGGETWATIFDGHYYRK